MGKSTISMAIFHCYVSSPEGMKNPPFLGGDFDHHRLAMASLWLATKVRLGDEGMMG